ncbi:type V CRISPR-associated protein Cas12a/Cpf1, partial [Peptostreptococcaceae bacterium OttesenSCG-928-C18]|nr:type V CRISPR-associated protein Cas12a/Cpf1 [Peptostreptococcaceae bacterium OttesenSCG-928-C18]
DNNSKLGREFNSIYNKSRNYLTKKQYSTEKFKLNFGSPTILKGWDINKETENLSMILRKFNPERKSYDYFLGIWNKDIPKKEKVMNFEESGEFEKMEYKLYPDPSKMLPKQFMSKKWEEKYPTSDEFKTKYKDGLHKKGEKFDKEFLHELIDRFKNGLEKHDEKYQEVFKFKLKETKDYNAYTEFIADVTNSNYRVSFKNVSNVEELVEEGKLYLFKIWSKDFSKHSKGTKNLNTIYFESLFSEENLEKNIFKLSGEAEVFYREKSVFHTADEMKNGHHSKELKGKFDYPIIKDKRFTEEKFIFHVPIQINYRSEDLSPKNLNAKINDKIGDFTHVIGIDRGERHLIYLSIVRIADGKLIDQKHLDEIVNINNKGEKYPPVEYWKKLDEKEKGRDSAKKSWETIQTIKELKEGYISQVVNEIVKLQKEYNALIVFEKLNKGFKNSRIKIDKQIYQKFETALIKKLNYVIDKKDPKTYLHGTQLTNPITKLDKIYNQSGIILYIPAWNTSKIDPKTGFVNLLYSSDLRYASTKKTLEFIDKIDKIYFEDGVFKFDIDFKNWNNRYSNSRTKWTLTSYGKRIETRREPNQNNEWCSKEIDLTKEFGKILNQDGTLVKEDVKTCKEFLRFFKLMLQMRNSKIKTDIDYMISPVMGNDNEQYDSKKQDESSPIDADANGAFNIARKGLMVIDNIKKEIDNPYKISNEEYLQYIQNKSY